MREGIKEAERLASLVLFWCPALVVICRSNGIERRGTFAMKVAYFCHELAPQIVNRDEDAIRNFASFLHRFVPEIPLEISPLDGPLMARVLKEIGEHPDIDGCAIAVGYLLYVEFGTDKSGHDPSLVVCCRADSTLAQVGKSAGTHAEWGCKYEQLVAVYHHDSNVIPYLVWHEMCHLFGAQDCYEVNATYEVTHDRTCRKNDCIMQHEPCKERVGDSPIICDANVDFIRKWASKHTKSSP
jgi:hypothetical protein